jgi:hypothetical protein
VGWASTGANLLAAGHAGLMRLWDGRTLEPVWVSFQTSARDITAFDASGRPLRSSPAALKEFVSLVERPGGGADVKTYDDIDPSAGKPSTGPRPLSP